MVLLSYNNIPKLEHQKDTYTRYFCQEISLL